MISIRRLAGAGLQHLHRFVRHVFWFGPPRAAAGKRISRRWNGFCFAPRWAL